MVVGDIARQNPLEMPLVQNNHVIQTFPPYGANGPFGIWVLPRLVAAQSRPHSDVPSHLSGVSAADRGSE